MEKVGIFRNGDELQQAVAGHVARDDLEHFLVADERFDAIAGIAGEQDADRVGGAFLGFAQRFDAAHAGEVLCGDDDVDRRFAERRQTFGTAGRTMHGIAIAESRT